MDKDPFTQRIRIPITGTIWLRQFFKTGVLCNILKDIKKAPQNDS